MSTRTARYNVSGAITSQLGQSKQSSQSIIRVGKVFGVVMDENTPSSNAFDSVGGWDGLGAVFYLDYPSNKNVSSVDLSQCKVARPLIPGHKYIPLKEELILLFELPSPEAQDNPNKTQTYYLSVISLWNNNHHNSQPAKDLELGNIFEENNTIKTLLPFEGDNILEGRTGNSLRFSNTTKYNIFENWWSLTGDNGDPVTLLTNGHNKYSDTLSPYVEDPNLDASALYLTSTQQVPINTRPFSQNIVFNPTQPTDYFYSQAILSGDRVTISAKKDEVLIFGNGIGLSSSNTIYLNSDKEILLDAPKILLGTNKGKIPTEPILLGEQTLNMLSTLITELKNLGTSLSSVASTPPGSPIIQLNQAGVELYTALENLTTVTNNLNKLKSTKSYTA
jgi:hypothetical protein